MNLDYEISTDASRIDVAMVHAFLSQSYWAMGRSREVVERSVQNSLCFGVYIGGRQVGFARVISDRAVFGYLADVFIIPEFRGKGLAKALTRAIVEHADVRDLQVFLLRTRDAQGLYTEAGFRAIPRPEEMMARYPKTTA